MDDDVSFINSVHHSVITCYEPLLSVIQDDTKKNTGITKSTKQGKTVVNLSLHLRTVRSRCQLCRHSTSSNESYPLTRKLTQHVIIIFPVMKNSSTHSSSSTIFGLIIVLASGFIIKWTCLV